MPVTEKVYRQRWGNNKGTIGQMVEYEIHNSPDYHDGELEGLKRKVEKTEEMIRKIVDCMSPQAKERLAQELALEEI